jgi:hypothetical protein
MQILIQVCGSGRRDRHRFIAHFGLPLDPRLARRPHDGQCDREQQHASNHGHLSAERQLSQDVH